MKPVRRTLLRRRVTRESPRAPTPYPVCDDLAAWCATRPDAQRVVVAKAFTTTRPPPRTLEPEVDASFAPLCSYTVPERAVVQIPGARLRGAGGPRHSRVGLALLPDGQFVGELVALTPAGRRAMLADEPSYTTRLPPRPEQKAGSYYAFVGFGMHHYYHWCHDLIMGAIGLAGHLAPDARIIVPADMRPFQRESLALLGLDPRSWVEFPADGYWELEHLHVITPKLKTQIDSPEPFRWFRDAAMARLGVGPARPRRRLYLTRRGDGHWRTVNEPAVEAELHRFGFETVAPGTLSFKAQAELFAEAEVIVGTGAGLFNMVFSPPGTKVLQLQEGRHIVHALWTQAAAMAFDYHYLLCDSVPNPNGGDADIHVPLGKLSASLLSMDL